MLNKLKKEGTKDRIIIHCRCKCNYYNKCKQNEWKYGLEDNYNIINIKGNFYKVGK